MVAIDNKIRLVTIYSLVSKKNSWFIIQKHTEKLIVALLIVNIILPIVRPTIKLNAAYHLM